MGEVGDKYFRCTNMVALVDREGYLKQFDQWTPEWAQATAEQAAIVLTSSHWAIIHILRDFYCAYQLVPSMRVWSKLIREKMPETCASTLYLSQLFTAHPLKIAARIAGLPKPKQCL